MMIVVFTGRGRIIVMMVAMRLLSDMRDETLPAMLQRNVRTGTEPGEQHQCRDQLAG